MRNIEEMKIRLEQARKEKEEATKRFIESLDIIVISKNTGDCAILNTISKKIEDNYYEFTYALYPTGTEKYTISIGKNISNYGLTAYVNAHYNKEFVSRTYPKKYENIFNELREAK